jgi:uncharacterized protein (DUF983 family)
VSADEPGRRPCNDGSLFSALRLVGTACLECGHVDVAHRRADKVCSVCEVVAEMHDAIGRLGAR